MTVFMAPQITVPSHMHIVNNYSRCVIFMVACILLLLTGFHIV